MAIKQKQCTEHLENGIAELAINCFLKQVTLFKVKKDLQQTVLDTLISDEKEMALTSKNVAEKFDGELTNPKIVKAQRVVKSNLYTGLTTVPNRKSVFYSILMPWKIKGIDYGNITFQFKCYNDPYFSRFSETLYNNDWIEDVFIASSRYNWFPNENGMSLIHEWIKKD